MRILTEDVIDQNGEVGELPRRSRSAVAAKPTIRARLEQDDVGLVHLNAVVILNPHQDPRNRVTGVTFVVGRKRHAVTNSGPASGAWVTEPTKVIVCPCTS